MKAAAFSRGSATILAALYLAAGAAPAYGQNGWTDGSNVVYTTIATDKVGIGTASPAEELHIHKASGTYPRIQITDNTTTDAQNNGLIIQLDGSQGVGFWNFENTEMYFATANSRRMTILSGGNVGIGTDSPQSKLAVDGIITAKEVKVTSTGWPDYVFGSDYNLMPLSAVAAYIAAHGHLPEVPSTEEVAANGISLGASQALLLKKIEELTLYMIEMQQENEALRERLGKLEN